MVGAGTLTRRGFVWQKIEDFSSTHVIGIIGSLLFLLLAIFVLWPLIAMLAQSIYGPEGFTLQYYAKFITKGYYYQSLYNTVKLGMIVTPLCLAITFCLAYITTRGPSYLRKPLKVFALLPLITPSFMFALSLILFLGRNGIITKALNLDWNIYGFHGCVIAQVLAFIPLAYLILENTMVSLNPNLEDAADNLGATGGKILRSITVPLLVPSLLKAALIIFAQTITAFGSIALLRGRVPFLAPDSYFMIIGEADFNMASVLSAFLILLCVVVFIMQVYFAKGKAYATIGGKPVATEPRHISRGILIPMLIVCFITSGLILVSFGVVIAGAFTKLVGIDNAFTLNWILDSRSNPALVNSVKVALLTGVFGGFLGVILAYTIVKGKFIGRTALEASILAVFAFPGTALGIGYILAFNNPPLLLTGTFMILVINSTFRTAAISVEAGITKLQQLSTEIEEASWNLGAGIITTFRRTVFPIIFPAFMYGFMYSFIRTMKTLSAIIFLISAGNLMLAAYIFDMVNSGQLGLASAATMKLTIIVGITLILIQYLSKWTGLSVTRRA